MSASPDSGGFADSAVSSDGATFADSGGPTDAGGLGDAPSALSGPSAFAVNGELALGQDLHAQCGEAPGPEGGYGAVLVLLSDVDLAYVCSADGGGPSSGPVAGHQLVKIQVQSRDYATASGLMADGGPIAPLQPGAYAIGFEDETDDDLCMIASTGGSALVDVLGFDDAGLALLLGTAVSGTVTLSGLTDAGVAGRFEVQLAPVTSGGAIAVDAAAPFSGQFTAPTCAAGAE